MLIRAATAPPLSIHEDYAAAPVVDEHDAGGAGSITIETLAPGALAPPHRSAAETVSFVLAGRLRCGASGEALVAGDATVEPAGCARDLRAAGREPARLLTVRAPASSAAPLASARPAARRVSPAGGDDPSLDRDGGFIAMGVRWLATAHGAGTTAVTLGTSTFHAAGGAHELHRHPHATEFLLVVSGGGRHLTEHGAARLSAGQLVLIARGEWHGFETDRGVATRTVFGYLGAASLAEAGYELREREGAGHG